MKRTLIITLLLLVAAFSFSQTNATFKNLDVRDVSKFRGLIYPFGASAKSPLSTSDEILMVELPSFKMVRVDFAEFADSITQYITIPTYMVSNRNTLGWYSRQVGDDFQFRGVKSTDGYIDFLDSNTYIGLTIDTANLFDAIPIPPQYWTFVDSATDTLYNNVAKGDAPGVVAIKGNLELQTTNSTASKGVIKQNGVNLFHTYHEKGDNNLFIGQGAGNFTADSSFNIGIGKYSLNTITNGYDNIGLGYNTGNKISDGYENIMIGNSSGKSLTTGLQNIFIGKFTGGLTSDGYNNTCIGYNSLIASGQKSYNVSLGWYSLSSTTIGSDNIAIGSTSLYNNLEGESNLAIGSGSLYSNKDNDGSTAIGYQAMYYADSRTTNERTTYNTAIGYEAMKGSTTAANNTGQYNTAVGYQSMLDLTSGGSNSVFGVSAGENIKSGGNNTLIGRNSGYSISVKSNNTCVGAESMSRGSGTGNTCLGYMTMSNATNSGDYNICIGYQAGLNVTTASRNLLMGYQSGLNLITGNDNIFLGNSSGYNETGSNKLYIENSIADSNNALIFGNFATDALTINGDLTVTGYLKSGTGSIADNDSTPSVASYNTFIYAGSANPVSIDALDDHVVGCYYTIIGNSNTYTITVIDGTPAGGDSFNLAGGNWVGGSQDVLLLYCIAADTFVEVSRSDN